MNCKDCGNELNTETQFCSKCGSKNPIYIKPIKDRAAGKVMPSLGYEQAKQEEKPNTKKCPFCAEEILYDAKKCKHCGEILDKSLAAARRVTTASPTPSYNNANNYSNVSDYKSERPGSLTFFCISAIGTEIIAGIIGFPWGLLGALIGLVPIVGLLMMKKWAAYFTLIINVGTLIVAVGILILSFNSGLSYITVLLLLQGIYNVLFISTIFSNMHLMD